MPFGTIEESLEFGQPIHLYAFRLGDTTWRYCTADRDVTTIEMVGEPPAEVTRTWKAVPISDEGIRQSGEAATDAMTITAPSNIGPVQTHVVTPPSALIRVAIFHKHNGSDDIAAVYAGEITQIDFPKPGVAKITAEALSATMQRDGLRLAWQRTCPYALYDQVTCKVDKSLHGVAGTVTAVVGLGVTIPGLSAHAEGFFAGGFIEWQDPIIGFEFRAIESHTGDALVMFGDTNDIHVGLTVTAYPGCARTVAACTAFGNLPNYGGIPHMPGRSPFDGNPVF